MTIKHERQDQRRALEQMVRILEPAGRRILEIGTDQDCNVLRGLVEAGAASAVGINPGCPPRASSDGWERLQADARDIPADDDSFDHVVSVATFEHINDLAQAVGEMKRVLRPGGRLYTAFSPIWTSRHGHHVFVDQGEHQFRFWRADLNPIPDFAHLLLAPEEMRAHLLRKHAGEAVEAAIDWIYFSDHINRMTYAGYLEVIQACGLSVLDLEPASVSPVPSPLEKLLRAKLGPENLFHVSGLNLLLENPLRVPARTRRLLPGHSETARPLGTRFVPIPERLAVVCPTEVCNYRCDYCLQDHKRNPKERDMDDWLTALRSIGAPRVHLTGGEPTLVKGIEEFVLNYPSEISITTNLSYDVAKRGREFWNKIKYATLSFHPQFTTLEEFQTRIDKLVSFFDKAPAYAITIVAVPEVVDKLEGWIDALSASGISARAQYAILPDLKYSREQLATLARIRTSAEESAQQFDDHGAPKLCNAGMFYVHIHADGTARRCVGAPLVLGNIFDGTFRWVSQELVCRANCRHACDRCHAHFSVLEEGSEECVEKEWRTLLFTQQVDKPNQADQVLNRLRKILQGHRRPVLFGAGQHTRWLIGLLAIRHRRFGEKMPDIAAIVDDNPEALERARTDVAHLLGKTAKTAMIAPDRLEVERCDAIILSTDCWQEQMSRRVESLWGGKFPVFDLYGEADPTPLEDRTDLPLELCGANNGASAKEPVAT